MTIRQTTLAAAFALAAIGPARTEGLKPLQGQVIDLGDLSGVAYYTVERDGFRVVTTLAQGEAGTPIRVVSVLAHGQHVVLSTASRTSGLEISRQGDRVVVSNASSAVD